jgi:hypothetical protein
MMLTLQVYIDQDRVSCKAASNNDQNDAQPSAAKFDRRFVWAGLGIDWKRPSKTVENHAKQVRECEISAF